MSRPVHQSDLPPLIRLCDFMRMDLSDRSTDLPPLQRLRDFMDQPKFALLDNPTPQQPVEGEPSDI